MRSARSGACALGSRCLSGSSIRSLPRCSVSATCLAANLPPSPNRHPPNPQPIVIHTVSPRPKRPSQSSHRGSSGLRRRRQRRSRRSSSGLWTSRLWSTPGSRPASRVRTSLCRLRAGRLSKPGRSKPSRSRPNPTQSPRSVPKRARASASRKSSGRSCPSGQAGSRSRSPACSSSNIRSTRGCCRHPCVSSSH